jgi:hypothetical protein
MESLFADIEQPKSIKGATFFRELRAGLTTFATMAYIIAVNVSLQSEVNLVFAPAENALTVRRPRRIRRYMLVSLQR